MRKELVYTHRCLANKSDCATISVQALIPHPIAPKSVDALFGNVFCLREATAVIAEELKCYGWKTVFFDKAKQLPPSRFFNEAAHTLVHGNPVGIFVGGLLAIEMPGQEVAHMVAITSLHERRDGKKVTIVDSGPKKKGTLLIRKVPLEWLDRNVMRSEGSEPTAIVVIAIPCKEPPEDCQDYRDTLIEQKLAHEGTIFTYNPGGSHVQSASNMHSYSKGRLKRLKRMKYT